MSVPTATPVSNLRLRPLRHADAVEVGSVAYATGFFGSPATPYFPDAELFTDLWVRPYLLCASAGFVAELDGRVVGYVVAALDWRAYRLAFARLLPAVLVRAVTGGYARPLGCVPYLLRAAAYGLPHASERRYPAHLHLNMLAQARGHGAGGALLDRLLAELPVLGVRGVQLSTTRANVAALALYEKRGFRTLRARTTPLWRPWLGHDLEHVVMGLELVVRSSVANSHGD